MSGGWDYRDDEIQHTASDIQIQHDISQDVVLNQVHDLHHEAVMQEFRSDHAPYPSIPDEAGMPAPFPDDGSGLTTQTIPDQVIGQDPTAISEQVPGLPMDQEAVRTLASDSLDGMIALALGQEPAAQHEPEPTPQDGHGSGQYNMPDEHVTVEPADSLLTQMPDPDGSVFTTIEAFPSSGFHGDQSPVIDEHTTDSLLDDAIAQALGLDQPLPCDDIQPGGLTALDPEAAPGGITDVLSTIPIKRDVPPDELGDMIALALGDGTPASPDLDTPLCVVSDDPVSAHVEAPGATADEVGQYETRAEAGPMGTDLHGEADVLAQALREDAEQLDVILGQGVSVDQHEPDGAAHHRHDYEPTQQIVEHQYEVRVEDDEEFHRQQREAAETSAADQPWVDGHLQHEDTFSEAEHGSENTLDDHLDAAASDRDEGATEQRNPETGLTMSGPDEVPGPPGLDRPVSDLADDMPLDQALALLDLDAHERPLPIDDEPMPDIAAGSPSWSESEGIDRGARSDANRYEYDELLAELRREFSPDGDDGPGQRFRDAVDVAIKAGWVDQQGQPLRVDIAGQEHRHATAHRRILGKTGRELESAHLAASSFLTGFMAPRSGDGDEDVRQYRETAVTVLLPPKVHRSIDRYWDTWARERKATSSSCTVQEMRTVLNKAISEAQGLTERQRGTLSLMLDIELFDKLGFETSHAVRVPHSRVVG
jgi:hypothetical protein